eukprot:SAG31_NODE_9439_length_1277_cov_1.428693_1_plen_101_part_00
MNNTVLIVLSINNLYSLSITAAAHVCMERAITRGYVGTAHKYWSPDLYTLRVVTRGYVGTAHEEGWRHLPVCTYRCTVVILCCGFVNMFKQYLINQTYYC